MELIKNHVAGVKGWWWSQIFSIFSPTGGNDPIWLVFFRWVETTNWSIIQVLCATQRMRMRWWDSSLLRSSSPSLRVRVRQESWENGCCEDNVFGGRLKYSHTASWNRRQTDGWKSESSVIFEAAVGACTQTGKLKSRQNTALGKKGPRILPSWSGIRGMGSGPSLRQWRGGVQNWAAIACCAFVLFALFCCVPCCFVLSCPVLWNAVAQSS